MGIVYLNGQYLPAEQAKVSVLDRGFLFGDGVYEVIPAYGGRLLRLAEHLRRLQNSLDGIRLDNPLLQTQWIEIIQTLLQENASQDQSVYLQVTRGTASYRDHSFPETIHATVFIMVNSLHAASIEKLKQGVCAISLDDIRWQACNIKATALLANVMLRQQATEKNCAEAILIRDGVATEGAASNIFIVKSGVIITPPSSSFLLPGITRDLIIELAKTHKIPLQERDVTEDELRNADEIWLTSSTKEIVPVLKLDDKTVSAGCYGPVWEKMIILYQDYKNNLRSGEVQ